MTTHKNLTFISILQGLSNFRNDDDPLAKFPLFAYDSRTAAGIGLGLKGEPQTMNDDTMISSTVFFQPDRTDSKVPIFETCPRGKLYTGNSYQTGIGYRKAFITVRQYKQLL